jgi:hypothetical protein
MRRRREGRGCAWGEIESGVSVGGETEIKSGFVHGAAAASRGRLFLAGGAAVRVIGNQWYIPPGKEWG